MPSKLSKRRIFNDKIYITDFIEYDSKLEARAVVLFLKAKYISVRARIIDKSNYTIIYFDEDTYNQIKYKKIVIPEVDDIPQDIKDMAIIGKRTISIPEKYDLGYKKKEITSNYMYGRKEKYEVLKLDKHIPKTELMAQTIDEEEFHSEDLNGDEDIEDGITVALEHIQNKFFESCPKCGSDMKNEFLVLGGNRRVAVYQCKVCKFFLPRKIKVQF